MTELVFARAVDPVQPTRPVPVLVVDAHELTGSALVLALRGQGHSAHRCPASGRAEVLRAAARLSPGLALLDLDGPAAGSTGLVGDLTLLGWRVLVVTGTADQAVLAAAVAAGAVGLLSKSSPLDRLYDVLEQAAHDQPLMPPSERRRWELAHEQRAAEADLLHRLTAREREVLERLADGLRAGTIAEHGGVSITTVRTHIRAVLSKLGVGSQLEAVALLRAGRN